MLRGLLLICSSNRWLAQSILVVAAALVIAACKLNHRPDPPEDGENPVVDCERRENDDAYCGDAGSFDSGREDASVSTDASVPSEGCDHPGESCDCTDAGKRDASAEGDASVPTDAAQPTDASQPSGDCHDHADASVPADSGEPIDASEPSEDCDAANTCGSTDPEPELEGWFVDSVTGSDENDGRASNRPFATLARLQQAPIISGTTVYLARGSFWREELARLPAGVKVDAYGSGPRPMIDGSDVAPNSMFHKSPDFTNVYEIQWTHDFASDGGKTAHRIWEDGTRLRRVTDVATCDATPGSFYAPEPTPGGPDTVYVHPTDSSSIPDNGHVYELTRRRWALQLYEFRNHATVNAIHTRRNAHADGSLVVDGRISDCLAEDGRVHNVFIRGVAENTTAWKIEPPATYGGATMFITYEDVIDLPGVVYRGCRALADGDAPGPGNSTNSLMTLGFFGHTSRGRSFGTAVYEDCETSGVSVAFGFQSVGTAVYYRSNAEAARTGVGSFPRETLAILGGKYHTWTENGSLVRYDYDYGVPKTVVVRGARLLQQASHTQPIWIDRPGASIEITRSTFALINGGTFRFANGDFVVKNNIIYGPNFLVSPNVSSATLSLVSDENLFYNTFVSYGGPMFQFFGGTLTTGLPGWRAQSGYELNSIDADPMFVGSPLMGDFSVAPDSPAHALGAGADIETEEEDAVLQEYRTKFTGDLAQW